MTHVMHNFCDKVLFFKLGWFIIGLNKKRFFSNSFDKLVIIKDPMVLILKVLHRSVIIKGEQAAVMGSDGLATDTTITCPERRISYSRTNCY